MHQESVEYVHHPTGFRPSFSRQVRPGSDFRAMNAAKIQEALIRLGGCEAEALLIHLDIFTDLELASGAAFLEHLTR